MNRAAPPKSDDRLAIVQLRIEPELLLSLRELARDNGQSVPGRIRVLIRRDVEAASKTAAAAS